MNWILISAFNYVTDIEYILFRNALSYQEIPFYAKDSNVIFMESCLSGLMGGIKIFVPENYALEAQELLNDIRFGQAEKVM